MTKILTVLPYYFLPDRIPGKSKEKLSFIVYGLKNLSVNKIPALPGLKRTLIGQTFRRCGVTV